MALSKISIHLLLLLVVDSLSNCFESLQSRGKNITWTTSVLVKEYIHEKLLFMSIVLIDKVIGDYPHNISSSFFS